MKIATIIGICTLASATAFGCSGSSGSSTGNLGGNETGDDGTSSGSAGASSGATSSSSGGASSGTTGASSGATTSSSGAGTSSGVTVTGGDGGVVTVTGGDGGAALDDPETDYTQTKTVTMDSFAVAANAEVYMCQHFVNPWGAQVDIKTYSLDMATGSHHMFAFYDTSNTSSAVAACPDGGNTFGAFTFTSQQEQVTQTYPATVGATIPANTGFNMMVHYLNTSGSTIMSHVALTMYVAKQNVVTQHAGVIFLNDVGILVPPGVSQQSPITPYTLPQDVYIMFSASHMHKEATNFIATAGSQTLFTTTQWAEPPAKAYSPPLHLTKGTQINWTCTYDNMTSTTLTFGESAQTNVMCISTSIFYPVSDVTNPVLGNAATF
jgi:hypothetical protein